MIQRLKQLLELIRFSHTIFALPFAILAGVMALVQTMPNGEQVVLRIQDAVGVLLCMVFARRQRWHLIVWWISGLMHSTNGRECVTCLKAC